MDKKINTNNIEEESEKIKKENDYREQNNKIIEERRNRFSGLTSYELLKVVKQTSGFPKSFSKNIPLETLVNFYNRFWNGEISDDESDTSSSL